MKPEKKIASSFNKRHTFSNVWEGTLPHHFNQIIVGHVFRDAEISLVCGGEDGVITVYPALFTDQKQLSGFNTVGQRLETKGGPIQALQVGNITNFDSVDVLAGDSRGMLTVFTNGQMLNRRKISEESISAVLINRDPAGNSSILVSCFDGSVLAVSPYSSLWKCKVDDAVSSDRERHVGQVEIRCMESLRVTTMSSDCVYSVVADNRRHVHFFQQDSLVSSLALPSDVTCMCTGHFLAFEGTQHADSKSRGLLSPVRPRAARQEQQLALGMKNGEILIVSNFLLYQYANVEYELSCLKNLASLKSDDATDSLVCSGHFNAVLVYKDTVLKEKVSTDDWTHTLDVINPSDGASHQQIIAGCLDDKVIILSVNE